jgi:enamine deaminase RidA (YjgF/YER057c/UK114 family)
MNRTSLLAINRRIVLLALFFVALVGSTARGDEPRLSIGGYDPVAYFTVGRPLQGKAEFEHVWRRLRWRFASGEHRDLFIKDPHRYTPQYDGYCAMGAADQAEAHKDTVDPEAWAIIDGKLYLVRTRYWLERWREQAAEYIKRADADWGVVADLPDPVIVRSPCAATSPPTNFITLRDGRRWLMVGTQVPRDEAGNVVGKGDMRAQLDQVGKNVGACLGAAGATVDHIVATTSFVAAPAEFDRHADLRRRYFGPPSPESRTISATHLSSPDVLLEVEAVAVIK